MTTVPDITRLLARIEDWKGQGPVLGRAEAIRRLDEAHKLLDEIANMLADVRRELLTVTKLVRISSVICVLWRRPSLRTDAAPPSVCAPHSTGKAVGWF